MSTVKKKMLRIALTDESCSKVERWLTQLHSEIAGPGIKQKQLLEWLILSRPDSLNKADIKDIREKYIDDVELAEWALQKIKAAKKQGRNLRLKDLIPGATPPKKRASKKTDTQESTQPDTGFTNPSED